MLAHVADEQVLKEIFRARRGRAHRDRAPRCFERRRRTRSTPGERSKAKMVNYGIVYGLSAYGLADRLKIPHEEAQEFIDALPRALPRGARVHRARRSSRPREEGYVTTLFGRRRHDPRAARAQLPGAHARRAPGGQHRRSRAPPPTSSRSRWSRCHARAARGRAADAAGPADPRRAAVRGPGGGGRTRRASSSSARWCARVRRSTRRWRSTSASGRTGWRPSRRGPRPGRVC